MADKKLYGITVLGSKVTQVTHCRKRLERLFDPRYIKQVRCVEKIEFRDAWGKLQRASKYEVVNG